MNSTIANLTDVALSDTNLEEALNIKLNHSESLFSTNIKKYFFFLAFKVEFNNVNL